MPSRRDLFRTLLVTGAAAAATSALPAAGAVAQPGGRGGAPAGRGSCRRVETVRLPDGLRPEGITSGPGSTFYVGSLADGRIVTGDLCSGEVEVLLPGATGRQVRGLFLDQRTRLLWAAGNVGTTGHVWAVDPRSGRVVADVVVPGAVFLNDLVVTRTTVWVTDSRVDRLTAIDLRRGRPTGAAPRFLPLGGAWPAGDGTAINANGIRTLPDGGLVLNNSRVGGLWEVSPETGEARAIPVVGGPGLVAGDGLERSGRTLYDVRGSSDDSVAVLTLRRGRDGWSAHWVTALRDDTLDVPSTATVAAGSLWAVNARFGVASPGTAEYWITRLPLR
ncbi:SMP-30/gluconolactonase/LRE family protein [Auraticoccus monumenti]|uniref:Sugar lactone lactonase YvrE n=1 Tax=Auraticoccus monumenti TaxID=675864 RepID=A0A1G6SEK8_9ACTN|nr:hypothetical protein [Auraticoccus monumenti]SDD15299.1 hypothetical protein SAMN04489747_0305 [Auraticoccus monumenti]